MDNKARALIDLHVEDDQFIHIRSEKTELASLNALKDHHERHTLSNKVHLVRCICELKLKKNELNELFQKEKLQDINEKKLSESSIVAMLLSSLHGQYDTLITLLWKPDRKRI